MVTLLGQLCKLEENWLQTSTKYCLEANWLEVIAKMPQQLECRRWNSSNTPLITARYCSRVTSTGKWKYRTFAASSNLITVGMNTVMTLRNYILYLLFFLKQLPGHHQEQSVRSLLEKLSNSHWASLNLRLFGLTYKPRSAK